MGNEWNIYKHTHTHSNKPTKKAHKLKWARTKPSTTSWVNIILLQTLVEWFFFCFFQFNIFILSILYSTANNEHEPMKAFLKSFSIFLLHFAINFYFHQKYQTIDIVLDYFNNNKELAIVKFGIFGGLVKRVWINLWLKINYVVIKYKYQQHGNSRYIYRVYWVLKNKPQAHNHFIDYQLNKLNVVNF